MTERAIVDTPTSTFLVIGFIMSTTSSRLAACGFCFYLHSEEESDFREGPGGSDRAGGEGSLAAQTRGYSCTWRFDLAGGRDCGWRLIPRLREMLICFAHRHNWRLAICLYGLSRSSHGLAAAVCVQWQPNQDARLGGERRALLRMLSFYSPLHAKAFSACPGSKRSGGLHGGTRQYAAAFSLDTPVSIETARFFAPY